jgi:hypothetical protein
MPIRPHCATSSHWPWLGQVILRCTDWSARSRDPCDLNVPIPPRSGVLRPVRLADLIYGRRVLGRTPFLPSSSAALTSGPTTGSLTTGAPTSLGRTAAWSSARRTAVWVRSVSSANSRKDSPSRYPAVTNLMSSSRCAGGVGLLAGRCRGFRGQTPSSGSLRATTRARIRRPRNRLRLLNDHSEDPRQNQNRL